MHLVTLKGRTLEELQQLQADVETALRRKAQEQIDDLEEQINNLRAVAGLKRKVTSKVMRAAKGLDKKT